MQAGDRRGLEAGVMQHHLGGVGQRILVLRHRRHDNPVRQAGVTQKLGATGRSGGQDERQRRRYVVKIVRALLDYDGLHRVKSGAVTDRVLLRFDFQLVDGGDFGNTSAVYDRATSALATIDDKRILAMRTVEKFVLGA
jgi:hypothetical protein